MAKLSDEYYVPVGDPAVVIDALAATKADIFTFPQDIGDNTARYKFHQEWDNLAVLPLTTYEDWLSKQIRFKARNKLKKALKSGMEIRLIEFEDKLVRQVMDVYNESPIRQGQRNFHYGKDFDTTKREHGEYLDRSVFIGAFINDRLIGFAKVVHASGCSHLMKIVSMVSQRDKAPNNALVAKAIEICAGRKVPYLAYSVWGKRPGLNEFKAANGFIRLDVPRYFVPLSCKGRVLLHWKLHRPFKDYLPEKWVIAAGDMRARWTRFRYRNFVVAAGASQDRFDSAQPNELAGRGG